MIKKMQSEQLFVVKSNISWLEPWPGCLMLRWVEWRGRLPGSDESKYMLAATGVELHHHNVYISTKIIHFEKLQFGFSDGIKLSKCFPIFYSLSELNYSLLSDGDSVKCWLHRDLTSLVALSVTTGHISRKKPETHWLLWREQLSRSTAWDMMDNDCTSCHGGDGLWFEWWDQTVGGEICSIVVIGSWTASVIISDKSQPIVSQLSQRKLYLNFSTRHETAHILFHNDCTQYMVGLPLTIKPFECKLIDLKK